MTRQITIAAVTMTLCATAVAENLEGADEVICAAGQAQICLETGECYAVPPVDLDIPEFVLIDTAKKTIRTTKASGENRATEFSMFSRNAGLITLQGAEEGRAFSFVIHEATGRLTAAITRDGLTVTVFGACTDSNL